MSQALKPKRISSKSIKILVGVTGLLLVVGLWAYPLIQDELAWRSLDAESANIQDFEGYIERYPDGIHRTEAQNRLEKLLRWEEAEFLPYHSPHFSMARQSLTAPPGHSSTMTLHRLASQRRADTTPAPRCS